MTIGLARKNFLITGATGFLGYHLTKRLVNENCNLILFGRNFKLIDSVKNQKSLIKIKGDLTKEDFGIVSS
jgi:short-subunit dehydrogenase